MKIELIADSCCDSTPAIRNTLGLKTAPLKITVDTPGGLVEYVDDEHISIPSLLADMKSSKKAISTAAPAPEDFARLMRAADACFVITLSHHLSGSYNAAMAARDMVLEETPEKKIEVLDSKSASAGELRIALQLRHLILQGLGFEEINTSIREFINSMRTFFVLEDLSNLVKNGRIPKMAGMIGSMLMLRPIMGENGDGEIISIEKVRGTKQALKRLVDLVAERTADAAAKSLVLTLSYCNCPERAKDVKAQLLQHCPALTEIIMAPTSGLSSCYANDGGIVIAYA